LKPFALTLAGLTAISLAACEQGKPRHLPPDPMAVAPPSAAAQPTAPHDGLSAGLPKRPEPAGFFLDRAGAAVDPRSRQPAVTPAAQPIVFDGFAFDPVAKVPAKGVEVVVDGKAYGAAYGAERPDVAQFFKAPILVKVGFKATLPAGSLTIGPHTVVLHVIAADGKSFYESPQIAFQAN
jgi:predicted small lipoprotein YifL